MTYIYGVFHSETLKGVIQDRLALSSKTIVSGAQSHHGPKLVSGLPS